MSKTTQTKVAHHFYLPFPELPSALTRQLNKHSLLSHFLNIWRTRQKLKDRFLLIAFFGFNCVVVLNIFFFFYTQPTQLLTGLLYLLRFDLIIAFGLAVFLAIKSNVLSTKEVGQTLTTSLLAMETLGFAQYFFFPDTRQLVLLGWDDHYYRMIGTIFDPGFLGIILAIAALVAVFQRANKQTSKRANLTLFLLFTLALLLTYSRASYVAFAIGVLWIAISQRSYRTLLILPLSAASLFFLPRPGGEGVNLTRTASIQARIESNQLATRHLSQATFLFGQGWYHTKASKPVTLINGEQRPNHASAPENSFVFVFSSLGIIGLGIWLGLLGSLWLLVGPTSMEAAVLIATSVHALFSNTLFHPFVLIVLAVIMARKLASVL